MAATVISFRWLDLLEKEFDKSFIDLDFILGEVAFEDDAELAAQAKLKINALSSCFAQLAHKAQTIFQINAKLEAEVVNLKQDLAESDASCQVIKRENEEILLKLHSVLIDLQKQSTHGETLDAKYLDVTHKKIIDDLLSRREAHLNNQTKREELVLLQKENEYLKKDLVSLQGDLCGAKLATKYLDKELSGRIQQLQLLHNGIQGDQHKHLWKQLESEIQLQRHKTIMRACRKNTLTEGSTVCSEEAPLPRPNKDDLHRFVTIERKEIEELGMTITGGYDHGIPVLISALNYKSAAGMDSQIYVGDAILSVNGVCLRDATQSKAASVLSSQTGNIILELVFVHSDDEIENDLLPDDDITNRYKIFDDDVVSLSSSVHLIQNGRLSRASIESIRGSTENILDTISNSSETAERYSETPHIGKNSENISTILLEKTSENTNNCYGKQTLNSKPNHTLQRSEGDQVENISSPDALISRQSLHLSIPPCDNSNDNSSKINLQSSELFNSEF